MRHIEKNVYICIMQKDTISKNSPYSPTYTSDSFFDIFQEDNAIVYCFSEGDEWKRYESGDLVTEVAESLGFEIESDEENELFDLSAIMLREFMSSKLNKSLRSSRCIFIALESMGFYLNSFDKGMGFISYRLNDKVHKMYGVIILGVQFVESYAQYTNVQSWVMYANGERVFIDTTRSERHIIKQIRTVLSKAVNGCELNESVDYFSITKAV